MKTAAFGFSLFLFVVVLIGVARTIFVRRVPFVRAFDDTTHHAYIVLVLLATGLFAWARLDLHVESFEIAGVTAKVGEIEKKVNTLSDQMEVFFQQKRIEIFDKKNWDQVRRVSKSENGFVLAVTLKQVPIPGSVEVYEGVLLMPEQQYRIDGKELQFPANSDTPVDGLTIKYYPRVPAS